MTKKQSAIISICVITLCGHLLVSPDSQARAFDEPDLLSQQIRTIAIKGETIDRALSFLADEYGVPVGIEVGDQKLSPDPKIDLELFETNVKDFLDAVIAKDPRYTWKLEGVLFMFGL